MEKENIIIKMVIIMLVNLKIIGKMEKELNIMKMEKYNMKEILQMAVMKGKEN